MLVTRSRPTDRRAFLQAVGAATATSLLGGAAKAANDRIAMGFIGVGLMGQADLRFAMQQPGVEVVALCDVYKPFLDQAAALAKENQHQPKLVADFREILADRSIDAVCIATPDHWHAYMTVEACKAGKDVYVEKPVSVTIDEGEKMVEAARKYKRVVQAGTMQRSGDHFQKAVTLVKSGGLGQVTHCETWTHMKQKKEGIGNPPDSDAPEGLDWDMWLGPAPKRPFNRNRFGADRELFDFSQFRYFWDYAGGMMTDWGVHLLDIVQWTFDEAMPKSVTATGGKYWLTDNRETPDTLAVTYEYPRCVVTFGSRYATQKSFAPREMKGWFDYGIIFYGSDATMYLDRGHYEVFPEEGAAVEPVVVQSGNSSNTAHWANFVECMRNRERPISDVEICHRSTSTCHLGNIALRSNQRIEWNEKARAVTQEGARKYMSRPHRAPWAIEV